MNNDKKNIPQEENLNNNKLSLGKNIVENQPIQKQDNSLYNNTSYARGVNLNVGQINRNTINGLSKKEGLEKKDSDIEEPGKISNSQNVNIVPETTNNTVNENTNSQNEKRFKSRDYYSKKDEDLKQKVADAKAEKEKDYKMKNPTDRGPVKADGSNTVKKSGVDKLVDNAKLLDSRRQRFNNQVDNVKNTVNKIEHPEEAAKEAVKDVAKEAIDKQKDKAKKAIKKKTNAVKTGAKKKIKAFILKNPWVIAVLIALLLLIILIVIIIVASEDDEVKKYDSTCNFNIATVDLQACNANEGGSMSLEEYVIKAAMHVGQGEKLTREQLKALMVIIKTNTLIYGDYNNNEKDIKNLYTCNLSTTESLDDTVVEIYEEIADYLYIDSSYTGTISDLQNSELLSVDGKTALDKDLVKQIKNKTGNFSVILSGLYSEENPNLVLYSLEDNCDYTMVSADSLSYEDACNGISLTSTSLSKDEFISLLQGYYANTRSTDKRLMSQNAGVVYDLAKNNSFNPELIPIRAELEGYSPGGSTFNYYGIGCFNGTSAGSCYSYSSFNTGAFAYIKLLKGYNVDNLLDVYYVKHYAYIGSNWVAGSSADGGCYYFPYIKKYMSEKRASVVQNACSSGVPIATNDEDQLAYSKWQIESSVEKRKSIFNISGENCETTSGNCTLYSQMDPKWGSVHLGTSSYTMAGAGCAVTSLAIGISCSGTEITIPSFDAGKFINSLNNGGCFTADGDIYWSCSTISKVAPNVRLNNTMSVAGLSDQGKLDIVNRYNQGSSFILLFYRNASTNGHWVVYSSVKGSNFSVKNPAGGKMSDVPISDVLNMVVYNY